MNYTELLAQIQDYTENTGADFVAAIPDFVKQAEDRILHTIQFPEFKKNSTSTLTASYPYLGTPSDYISAYSLAVLDGSSDYSFLINKDVNFLRQAYEGAATTGLPKYYAQWDHDTFMLAPTPDSNYTVELHYFYKPESIVTATNTWIGDNIPIALFYGSLLEAYIYMKGEQDLIGVYDARFKEALERAKMLGDGRLRQDAYRSGQIRLGDS